MFCLTILWGSKSEDKSSMTGFGRDIPFKPANTLLGVTLDQELRFREQAAKATAKGTQWVQLFTRLARPSFGLRSALVRQLYLGVAVPRMLYAVEVWDPPVPLDSPTQARIGRISRSRSGKLASVNRRAAVLIAGALRTSPADLVEIHANLLPIDLLVNKMAYRATLRLAALPVNHPLHQGVVRAGNRYVQRHRSPLHELLHTYHIDPATIETRAAVMHAPGWTPSLSINIAKTAADAIDDDAGDTAHIKAYADGSGLEGGIGAAATSPNSNQTLRLYLGPDNEHIVYEAEVVGLLLALHLLSTTTRAFSTATIGIDNQAAIRGIEAVRPTSAHRLWKWIDNAAVRLKSRGKSVQVRWVPGHSDVAGNEEVDGEAKAAARGDSTIKRPHDLKRPLQHNIAALRAYQKKELVAEHHRRITTESYRYFNGYCRIDPAASPSQYRKHVRGLTRPQESLLAQLRMGHVGLNAFLFRIKRAETATCPACGNYKDTVAHFLFQCFKYRIARAALPRSARTFEGLLNTRSHLPALFAYVVASGRFPHAHISLKNFTTGDWKEDEGIARGRRERVEE
jgi:ribonuclease HI